MKHKHAELMLQYAQDAMETATPWERWESYDAFTNRWIGFSVTHPSWSKHHQYRRKPRTIRIGECDVPEPCREKPKRGTKYYFPQLSSAEFWDGCVWLGDDVDFRFFKNGLVHLTKEAAIIHGQALASLTAQKGVSDES